MTRRSFWTVAAAAAATTVGFAQPFTRDDWNRNGYVLGTRCQIVNLGSGKFVELDGSRVLQHATSSQWEIRKSPAGGPARYRIVHRTTGMVLTEVPSNIAKKPSALIAAPPADDDINQDWRIESYGDGSVMLIAASGKALDVPGGSRRDGVPLQTFLRNGDSNQRFVLRMPDQQR
ncbi:hypothetical protein F183_A04290 [Bryobacterales bacterium F-183]|nr:hypothetical protein F183_A04290 [Bryobacterales bacterium F-183]